ncbi:hypothetical protein R1sor_012214 [Riccia sorocarpa]|uniref:Uncharacterized protein n=1 Tax=Riccia sorocarpa TaxID=122646 RepID=A0ABD3I3H2_9MARC
MAGSKLLGLLSVLLLLFWSSSMTPAAIAVPSELPSNSAQAELPNPPPPTPPLPSSAASTFVQHSNKFWAYDRATQSWSETDVSCLFSNGSWWHSCSIGRKADKPSSSDHLSSRGGKISEESNSDGDSSGGEKKVEGESEELSSLMRISMVRFSDVSLWITGQSGAIYERFWNGVQWVVIPHDLPAFAGRAISVLSVNRTMVTMSESGVLYQLQIDGSGQLLWVNCGPWLPSNTQDSGVSSSNVSLVKSGLVSADDSAVYFATTDGSLTELQTLHPMKWVNHYHPRGGDVAAIADAGTLRSGITFTISTSGDLYEFDYRSKPAWKKHVRKGSVMEDLSLAPSVGVAVHGLAGAASASLFLLTKDGVLVERRFQQSKWRWILHPVPDDDDPLSRSLGPLLMEAEPNSARGMLSLFLTSENGVLWEYKLAKGNSRTAPESGVWLEHGHPFQTPIVKSVPGVSLSPGRIFFSLLDGRIGELHIPGLGGGNVGPVGVRERKQQVGSTTTTSTSYTWSILEAPETEGGNAEYCTSVRGPANCLEGIKDSQSGWQPPVSTSTDSSQRKRTGLKGRTWRRGGGGGGAGRVEATASSSPSSVVIKDIDPVTDFSTLSRGAPWNGSVESQFMLRTMQAEKSIFFVGRDGTAFERFLNGETWLWLKHEHTLSLTGIVGIYSGGVFVVDAGRNLFLRERIGNVLHWLNCTEMSGGRRVVSGPPWDHGLLGETHAATVEDALFLVDEAGNLMEFLVALRQFAWRDCGHPPGTTVAAILDQETLRYRVVFVVGVNGRLYHFNRVTRQWISHHQPQNVLLSPITGTVVRPNIQSTRGSLFMRTEDGGMVEFHWDTFEGWKWTDHGFPEPGVNLSTSPGPNIGHKRLFVVGSDGKLYSRFWDETQWAWIGHEHPKPETVLQAERNIRNMIDPDQIGLQRVADETDANPVYTNLKYGVMDVYVSFNGECNLEVASIRPVSLSSSVVMVVLHDGRVASLKSEDGNWKWVSVHDTPTSSCQSSYWAATGPQIS